MTECKCGRPTRDVAQTCDYCGDMLARVLGEVPWLDEELDVTIAGQRAVGTSGATSRSAEKASPVNWGAAEARDHLRGILVAWVKFCDEEQVRNREVSQDLPADTIIDMSRWLLCRVDGLMLLDIGSEAVEEITNAVAECRRVIDRPADRLYLGSCTECGAQMWAKSGRAQAECGRCGSVYSVAALREGLEVEAMDGLMDRLHTASEAAMILCAFGLAPAGVDEVRLADKIRKWAKPTPVGRSTVRPARLQVKGHVKRADQRTRPAYRLGDIRDLLAQSKRKAA